MTRQIGWVFRCVLALGLLAPAASPVAADQATAQANVQANLQDDQQSYGYLRVVEGEATLVQAGSDARIQADVNQPVLVGDRISVPNKAKVELVLADRNLVRLDGGSDLLLEHLAESPDANDRATVLRLLEGNMQVVVTQDSLGDELPRIDTPNATIYPQDFGMYRITADQDWSEVTVRRGKAEVVTDGGSRVVRADEHATIEGDRRIAVDSAPGFDSLERWAQRLDQDQQADLDNVDEGLRYSAAPLNRYGSWVTVEDQSYWRPRVDDSWRPYSAGRWVYTPSGMTWVSYEPWGWVPYHYGSWDFINGYGWLWRPGYVYSPAWVYWYWGPSYTGWCPIGYYSHYYASVGFRGFHSGLYGWAGGDWGLFARWTFVPGSYFRGYRDGYRAGFRDAHWREQWDVRRHAVPIDEFRRNGRHLDRGLITTDTRHLTPDTWGDSHRAVEVLRRQPGQIAGKGGGELPDVSSFIARKPQLPPTVAHAIVGPDDINRYTGTPLRPSTLGRGDRGLRGARVTPVPQGTGSGPAARSGRPGRPGSPGGNPQPGTVTPGTPGATPGTGGRTPRLGRTIPDQGGNTPQPGTDRSGRAPRTGRPDAGDQGGAPRPDRGGNADRGDRSPRVHPIAPAPASPPSAGEPATRTPRPAKPAPGDQGGAPRPDRGERAGGPRVTPVEPSGDQSNGRPSRGSRPAPADQGGAPRPDRGVQSDRGSQGSSGHQGDRNQGDRNQGRGNQDRGSASQGDHPKASSGNEGDRGKQDKQDKQDKQEKKDPPQRRDRSSDQPPPPYRSTYLDRGDRSSAYSPDRGSRPAERYTAPSRVEPRIAPERSYRPTERYSPPARVEPWSAPERSRPAERYSPPPRVEPRPAPERSASPGGGRAAERPSRPAAEPQRRERRAQDRGHSGDGG